MICGYWENHLNDYFYRLALLETFHDCLIFIYLFDRYFTIEWNKALFYHIEPSPDTGAVSRYFTLSPLRIQRLYWRNVGILSNGISLPAPSGTKDLRFFIFYFYIFIVPCTEIQVCGSMQYSFFFINTVIIKYLCRYNNKLFLLEERRNFYQCNFSPTFANRRYQRSN